MAHRSQPQTSARSASQVQTDQSAADALYITIAGTAVQRGAGDALAYQLEEDPLTQCMKAAGIDYYTPMPFVDQWSDWPAGGASTSDTDFLSPVNNPAYWAQVEQAQAAAENRHATNEVAENKAYTSLTDSQKKAWDAAIGSCSEGTGFEDAWHPDQYFSLDYAYHAMVDTVDLKVAGTFGDAYKQCMSSAGYDGIANHRDLVALLESKLPPVDQIPDPGSQGGDAWNAWLNIERDAVAADGICRTSAYAEGMAELGPKIQAFASDRATELAAEEAGWEKITGQ